MAAGPEPGADAVARHRKGQENRHTGIATPLPRAPIRSTVSSTISSLCTPGRPGRIS
jgi:hypothetical protein